MKASGKNSLDLSNQEVKDAFEDSIWAEKFPPILTVELAADLAGVPQKTVYEWSSRGLLRGCANRFGKRLRIHRDRFVQMLMNE